MISRHMFMLAVIIGVAVTAAANPIPVHGWEDCPEAVLGLEGPGMEPILATVVTAPDPVGEGSYSLRLEHNTTDALTHPKAHLAYVENLGDGAQVVFSIGLYDPVPAGGTCWIRGRFTPSGVEAGGPDMPVGSGWQSVWHTWELPAGDSGLIIYAEMPGMIGDTVWLDEMVVFLSGSNGHVQTPCYEEWVVPVAGSTLSEVKDLFR